MDEFPYWRKVEYPSESPAYGCDECGRCILEKIMYADGFGRFRHVSCQRLIEEAQGAPRTYDHLS